MPTFTLPPEMKAVLDNLTTATELLDEEGHLVGRFVPKQTLWSPTSDEEARRRLQANEPRFTTEEVIRYLESL